MKLNRKVQNICLAVAIAVSIAGLLVGTFNDYDISLKVADENNLFGILFTAFGVLGSLTVGTFASVALFFAPNHPNKKINFLLKAAAIGGFVLCNFFEISVGTEYADYPRLANEKGAYKALLISLIVIIDLIIILFTKLKFNKLDDKVLVPTCLTILFILFVFAGGSEFIKYLVSRPRPRVVFEGEEYRPWYIFKPLLAFNKPREDFKSFISGHAANSACLMTILPLALSMGKNKNKLSTQIIAFIIGFLFTFVVSLSRVLIGAHFLSDVTGGILMSSCVGIVIYNITELILQIMQEKR